MALGVASWHRRTTHFCYGVVSWCNVLRCWNSSKHVIIYPASIIVTLILQVRNRNRVRLLWISIRFRKIREFRGIVMYSLTFDYRSEIRKAEPNKTTSSFDGDVTRASVDDAATSTLVRFSRRELKNILIVRATLYNIICCAVVKPFYIIFTAQYGNRVMSGFPCKV